MDDFIIPTKTMEELEERTIRFLKIAEKDNLCFKRSKCDFNMEEIPILGVIVGKGQVNMEQENFYQQFIQNFSHTAKPLNELKSKKDWK